MRFRDCIREDSDSDSGSGGARRGSPDELEVERRWLLRAKIDNQQFRHLYEKYYPIIYRFIYWKTLDPDLSEDLTSDTFVKAQDNLGRYRWQRRPFGAWLHKIAISLLCKELKRRARTTHWDEERMQNHPSSQSDPLTIMTKKEEQRQLYRCLAELDETSQNIFFLRYGHGYRVKKVAAILGMRLGTVKSRLKRDIKKIQKNWPDPDSPPPEAGK